MPRLEIAALVLVLALPACHRRSEPVAAEAPDAGAPIPRFDVHSHIGPFDFPTAMKLYASQGIVGFLSLSGGQGQLLDVELEAAKAFPGRALVATSVNARGLFRPGWLERELEQLRVAKAKGARGLKFHKALGLGWGFEGARVKVDDPRLDPLFEEAGKLGLVVSIHTGDPKAFFQPMNDKNERWDELKANPDWSFYGNGFPTWEELFAEYERRVARHPKTTFIGVHFGNDPEDPVRVGQMLDQYPNLYVDTAARVGEIGRQKPEVLRALFVKHRTHILFGTDLGLNDGELMLGAPDGTGLPPTVEAFTRFMTAHWRFFETHDRAIAHPTPIQGRWTVDAIGLPREVLEDVYHRNAERLFGLAPLTVLPRPIR